MVGIVAAVKARNMEKYLDEILSILQDVFNNNPNLVKMEAKVNHKPHPLNLTISCFRVKVLRRHFFPLF